MTNGKCQEQEEEQEQQLLPLYDLAFAAGKKYRDVQNVHVSHLRTVQYALLSGQM